MTPSGTLGDKRPPPCVGGPRVRKATLRDRFIANGAVGSIAIFFVLVCLLFTLTTGAFLTAPNLLNIVRQSAPLLIVAASMTFVITTGRHRFSVGSVLALSAPFLRRCCKPACLGRS